MMIRVIIMMMVVVVVIIFTDNNDDRKYRNRYLKIEIREVGAALKVGGASFYC